MLTDAQIGKLWQDTLGGSGSFSKRVMADVLCNLIEERARWYSAPYQVREEDVQQACRDYNIEPETFRVTVAKKCL